jgi:hypothetical protein
VASFRHRPIYRRGKSLWHLLDSALSVPHSRCECSVAIQNDFIHMFCTENIYEKSIALNNSITEQGCLDISFGLVFERCSVGTPVFCDWSCRGSSQSLQANAWIVLRIGHDRFLPDPFQFVFIHLSSYCPTLYSPHTEIIVKNPQCSQQQDYFAICESGAVCSRGWVPSHKVWNSRGTSPYSPLAWCLGTGTN